MFMIKLSNRYNVRGIVREMILFVVITPNKKVIVWIIINNGNFDIILIVMYISRGYSIISFFCKLYTTTDCFRLVLPSSGIPIASCIIISTIIHSSSAIKQAQYLLNNILTLE